MTTIHRWLLLAGLAGLGACAAGGGTPPSPNAPAAREATLAGTRWVGVVEKQVPAEALPRLEFVSDSRITGFTGCNMLSGTWRREGGEVLLGRIVTTKRMCLGPGGEVEQRLLAVLADDTRAVREGARLLLHGPSGQTFAFTPG